MTQAATTVQVREIDTFTVEVTPEDGYVHIAMSKPDGGHLSRREAARLIAALAQAVADDE